MDQARALRLDILESQLKDLKARIQPLEEDLLRRQARRAKRAEGPERDRRKESPSKARPKNSGRTKPEKGSERARKEEEDKSAARTRFRERTTGTDPGDQTGGPGARDAPKFPLRRNREAGQGDLRERRKGQKVLAEEREREDEEQS